MILKSAAQKLKFLMEKLYQKVVYKITAANPLARSRIVTQPHFQ